MPLQRAFAAPLELRRRIGTLEAGAIAHMDPAVLDEAFRKKPALHRFPGSMASRTQELCALVEERYGGDAARIWTEATDALDLQSRLYDLPGFGDMKVRTILAVLAKQLGVRPAGIDELLPKHMSLGDVDSPAGARGVPGRETRAQSLAPRRAEAVTAFHMSAARVAQPNRGWPTGSPDSGS